MGLFDWLTRRGDRQGNSFAKMAERTGTRLDPATGEGMGPALDQAMRRCLMCGHDVECRDTEPHAEAPEYCPNAPFFAAHGGSCKG